MEITGLIETCQTFELSYLVILFSGVVFAQRNSRNTRGLEYAGCMRLYYGFHLVWISYWWYEGDISEDIWDKHFDAINK